MKNIILLLSIIFIGTSAFAFYDFCESPQDYNTFPPAYDFKTEYWKDIPKYQPDDIKYKNYDKNNPVHRTFLKKAPDNKKNYSIEK